MKTIHVQYFALLREQRGLAREDVGTTAATPAELYAELRTRHNFTLAAEQLRVAIGGEFVPWTRSLESGADVVFIPPVAGG
ncbi:MAG TPA: MoaD/ThiS family protein [Opitutaceae bacterium]